MNATAVTDAATTAYFDSYTPEYSVNRLEPAAEFIRAHAELGDRMVDIGCGVGNTLEYLAGATPVTGLAGIDVSANCLEETASRVKCETYLGSILDSEFAAAHEHEFDFAIVSAVLHHLVGKTRRESRANARLAVANSLRMLRPGGYLVVQEPVFEPRLAMDAVFHAKRGVGRFSDRRVPLLGYWGNIGQPVVSYYSTSELRRLIIDNGSSAPAPRVVSETVTDHQLTKPLRWLMRRRDATLVLVNVATD